MNLVMGWLLLVFGVIVVILACIPWVEHVMDAFDAYWNWVDEKVKEWKK